MIKYARRSFIFFYLTILLGIFPMSCKQADKIILAQNYYFLAKDNEMSLIRQIGDSLFSMKCYVPFNCNFTGNNREIVKKISIIKEDRDVYLLYVTSDIVETKRRRWQPDGYWVIRKVDSNIVKQYTFFPYLITNKSIAEKTFEDVLKNEDKFGFTLYSKSYLEQFANRPTINNVADVDKILTQLQLEKYRKIVEMYIKEKTGDMYLSGITSELYTLSCIELGFNPIGASFKIDSIRRVNRTYFDEKWN